jgi:hypothetical protein
MNLIRMPRAVILLSSDYFLEIYSRAKAIAANCQLAAMKSYSRGVLGVENRSPG